MAKLTAKDDPELILEMEEMERTTPAHYDEWNTRHQQLLNNDSYLEKMYRTMTNSISDAWNSSKTYTVGEYSIYDNSLWKCLIQNTNVIPVEGTYWTKVSIVDEIKSVNTKIGTTDISSIGDGTATGGLKIVNDGISQIDTVPRFVKTVDLSDTTVYDPNTWYLVHSTSTFTFKHDASIEIKKQVWTGIKENIPWSTHNTTNFNIDLQIKYRPSNNGMFNAEDKDIIVIFDSYRYAKEKPIYAILNNNKSGNILLYMRGGAKYDIWCSFETDFQIETSDVTFGNTIYSPKTSEPTEYEKDMSGNKIAKTSMISDKWDRTKTYYAGDYCLEYNQLWKCKGMNTGAEPSQSSGSTYWTNVTIASELNSKANTGYETLLTIAKGAIDFQKSVTYTLSKGKFSNYSMILLVDQNNSYSTVPLPIFDKGSTINVGTGDVEVKYASDTTCVVSISGENAGSYGLTVYGL